MSEAKADVLDFLGDEYSVLAIPRFGRTRGVFVLSLDDGDSKVPLIVDYSVSDCIGLLAIVLNSTEHRYSFLESVDMARLSIRFAFCASSMECIEVSKLLRARLNPQFSAN